MSGLSSVHMACASCSGYGRTPPDWDLCKECDGLGRVWEPGAPDYGCKMLLSDRNVGEIVELGNGERGRIVRHDQRGTPTTVLVMIGLFDGAEDTESTHFPSCVGVRSVSLPAWFRDTASGNGDRQDILDPLRGK